MEVFASISYLMGVYTFLEIFKELLHDVLS